MMYFSWELIKKALGVKEDKPTKYAPVVGQG